MLLGARDEEAGVADEAIVANVVGTDTGIVGGRGEALGLPEGTAEAEAEAETEAEAEEEGRTKGTRTALDEVEAADADSEEGKYFFKIGR